MNYYYYEPAIRFWNPTGKTQATVRHWVECFLEEIFTCAEIHWFAQDILCLKVVWFFPTSSNTEFPVNLVTILKSHQNTSIVFILLLSYCIMPSLMNVFALTIVWWLLLYHDIQDHKNFSPENNPSPLTSFVLLCSCQRGIKTSCYI